MSVEVRIDQGAISRLLRRRGGRAFRTLSAKTERVAALAEAGAPGRMGDRVTWRVVEGPRGLQGVVSCDHPAVHFVLNGTRPHLIRPRRKSVLRFEVGGRVVFTRLVRHPGTRANDFMGRALRQGR
ncbi:hypothetical protein [Streptomyces anulatus]|uniref:hypothetical protein n=1 Tax=Streptomyces anulatus TaxID=1892 RepID=UPI0034263658